MIRKITTLFAIFMIGLVTAEDENEKEGAFLDLAKDTAKDTWDNSVKFLDDMASDVKCWTECREKYPEHE